MAETNLVEFPRPTLADISRVLRAIADSCDAGEYGDVYMAAIVLRNHDGDVHTFGGGGGVDNDRAVALFTRGIADLMSK